jgi:hypothetical protein
MLEPGERIPLDARVWKAPREGPVTLAEAIGSELTLLCFYLWDWSPT